VVLNTDADGHELAHGALHQGELFPAVDGGEASCLLAGRRFDGDQPEVGVVLGGFLNIGHAPV
jgi:hypothetical protein